MLKQCPHCRKIGEGPKPLSSFNKSAQNPDGADTYCRTHRSERSKARYRKQGDQYAARRAKWHSRNPEKRHLYDARKRVKEYGLLQADYERMLDAQQHRCKICERAIHSAFSRHEDRRQTARVDHCHATKAVRGLLCLNCNAALGAFADNPAFLLAAVRYLQDTATAKVVSRPRDEKSERNDEPLNAGPLVEQRRGSRRDELNQFLN